MCSSHNIYNLQCANPDSQLSSLTWLLYVDLDHTHSAHMLFVSEVVMLWFPFSNSEIRCRRERCLLYRNAHLFSFHFRKYMFGCGDVGVFVKTIPCIVARNLAETYVPFICLLGLPKGFIRTCIHVAAICSHGARMVAPSTYE